ncbi:substrate-binding domain-containing protein [Blastococcus sp. PRF04-17]|uniref:substrate-binding domain-containing protein n=1 Tax=Blastococcus sp. PRF04-17 TaxID=2933797 RepID=UPI001FF1D083|nr:substrate-binding domain-containing protein [Blastococcus sp. PRF04-17]UOY02599.1 substrate-binding domain-containing protein [Blastococcus sp. PRF04-17]
MGNLMRRRGVTRGRGRPALIAVTALALTLTACGNRGEDDGGGGGGGGSGSESSVDLDSIDDADVQETVSRAFLTDEVQLDDLDPTVQEAFRRATIELTPEQLDKAFECWSETSCEIGDGEVTVGIAEAFGQNQWRRIAKMEAILQALTYPNVGRIISTDAQGDLATFQSNVRSLAAQGATAIVSYNDFGAAALPAFQAAQQQGAFISTYVGPVPDAPPTSLASQVHGDVCAVGEEMAEVAQEDLGLTGQVAILNGTPGNPQGATWNKCFEDALGPDLTVGTKLDTDWTLAGAFEAASALVSSGQEYSGIFYDYADPIPQVIEAFNSAGVTPPPIVTWTANNGMAKVWEEALGTEREFPIYFTNGLNWQSRVSITSVMGLLAGDDVAADIIVPQPFVQAEEGLYDPNRPDDYPGPSVLIPDDLLTRMLSAD